MNKAPYTLSEAQKISREYQHLIGHVFDAGKNTLIDCVAVSPFDQVNKNRFLIYYLLFDDAHIALQQDYNGMLFDVVVIAGASNGDEMVHDDIHTWLVRNGALLCQPVNIVNFVPVRV